MKTCKDNNVTFTQLLQDKGLDWRPFRGEFCASLSYLKSRSFLSSKKSDIMKSSTSESFELCLNR